MPYCSKGQTASGSFAQPRRYGAPPGLEDPVQRPPGHSNPVQRPPGLHGASVNSFDQWERPPGFGGSK